MGINDFLDWHLHMDNDSRAAFQKWKGKHPYGTFADWWDIQAHKKSGGVLPNPMNNPETARRLKRK